MPRTLPALLTALVLFPAAALADGPDLAKIDEAFAKRSDPATAKEEDSLLAEAMTRRGLSVVLTAAPEERAITARIAEDSMAPVLDLTGKLSLTALVGVLARASLMISNDTGPLHLAAALGTRSVGIYWIGNLLNSAPLGRARHRAAISWTMRCPQCGADGTRDPFPARTGGTACTHSESFVDEVQVEEVLQAADALLSGS